MTKEFWIGDVLSGKYDDAEVELCGWVHRTRGSKKIRFVVLRDSTGTLQCVIKRDTVGEECFESLSNALIESSVRVKGTVKIRIGNTVTNLSSKREQSSGTSTQKIHSQSQNLQCPKPTAEKLSFYSTIGTCI